MTLEPDTNESIKSDIDWTMAAAGIRSGLFSFARVNLTLVSEVLRTSTGPSLAECCDLVRAATDNPDGSRSAGTTLD